MQAPGRQGDDGLADCRTRDALARGLAAFGDGTNPEQLARRAGQVCGQAGKAAFG